MKAKPFEVKTGKFRKKSPIFQGIFSKHGRQNSIFLKTEGSGIFQDGEVGMLFDFREHRFRNGNGLDAEGVFDADNTFLSTDDTDEGFDRQLNRFTVIGQ